MYILIEEDPCGKQRYLNFLSYLVERYYFFTLLTFRDISHFQVLSKVIVVLSENFVCLT